MIKQIKEINFPQYATLSQAKVNINDMGDMSISAQVKIDGDIKPDFSYDWEVEFKGERYIQPYRSPQGTKDNSSRSTVMELTFYHKAEWMMRTQMFVEMASTESGTAIADKYEASLGLSLSDFVTAFNNVLNYFFGNAIVMTLNPNGSFSSERKYVNISYSYIWDVLQQVYEIYGVRWKIKTDENGVFMILVGYDAEDLTHIFEYGFEGGLMSVQRQVQSMEIRNRLLGRGGEKNLPAYYFKKSPDDSLFESDPDWIPELANIYFSNLRGKTFRDYVKGWKAKHYGGAAMSNPTEAYTAGYTDEKFNPIEYVDDADSIAKYGVIIGGLDNNEDIYPSIQGAEGGVDTIVAAEQVEDDDQEAAADSESQIINVTGDSVTAENVASGSTVTLTMAADKRRHKFTIPEGNIGYVQIGEVSYIATYRSSLEGRVDLSATIITQSIVTHIFNSATDAEVGKDAFSNLPAGTYYWSQEITLLNGSNYKATSIKATFNGLKVTYGTGVSEGWKPTFNIWVKNIWGTTKGASESDTAYADRVWLPILGDRLGNEAKVVFTSGWLSFSSDWEFTIVDYAYDTSVKGAEWRLTLQKSDAELDATGKFIPNSTTNAVAGDTFFFIGIDMPHQYVLWAEQRLDDYKRDQLESLAKINPTWVVQTDKVRLNQVEKEGGSSEGSGGSSEEERVSIADTLSVGCSLRLTDKRLIDAAYVTLYIQSISYNWDENTIINPDIDIVLSDKPSPVVNPVSQIQGNIEELNKNVTSLSSIKNEILSVIDSIYLRKDGIKDLSLSQTEFRNLINGLGFRKGRIGGSGWGIYRDSVGKAVGEFDRLVVRDSLDVASITVEQVKQFSGTQIFSEAGMVCTEVVDTNDGYYCYYDTKGGEITNMFQANDIAWCLQFDYDSSQLKYYKRRVISVGSNYILLSKTDYDGTGIPEANDSIVQFGNFTNKERQSAIALNPHDGGSIVVYSGIDGYDITDRNKVGLGFSKETGKAFLYGYGEFFFGDRNLESNYITFQQKEGDFEPKLYIKGNITIGSESSGLSNLSEWKDAQSSIDSAASKADSAYSVATSAKTTATSAKNTAEAAKTAAESATTAANEAKASADAAKARLDDFASDSIISPMEKTSLVQQKADIMSEYGQIVSECTKYGVAYTAFTTAYNNALAALNKYTKDMTVDTPKESDYDNISAYYTARQTVLNSVATAAKKVADDAMIKAQAAETEAKAATANASEALSGVNKLNDDNTLSIPEKRTLRQIMQAITVQKGTKELFSGTISRSMVSGSSWVKVTQADADANRSLSNFVGFYRSQNRANSSYSTVKLTFNMAMDGIVKIEVASVGEVSNDYLAVSTIDPISDLTSSTLSSAAVTTKDKVGKIISLSYGLTTGTHTLQIMYRKDSSVSSLLDSGFYRITTEMETGKNAGLAGSFHSAYWPASNSDNITLQEKAEELNRKFDELVDYLNDPCHIWNDTETALTNGATIRDNIMTLIRDYYDLETETNKLVATYAVKSDYDYLKQTFKDGSTTIDGGVIMSEAVAVKNESSEVEAMLNGSSNFSEDAHGKMLIIAGIPSVSSSGSSLLSERIKEAQTIVFEDGTVRTTMLEGKGGTFAGSLNAVDGTFKKLICVNSSGEEIGAITFSTEGRLWFDNCDLYHQGTKDGRSLRFYASDFFARGTFGAYERTAILVEETTNNKVTAKYYNGLSNPPVYTQTLSAKTDTGRNTYYTIDLYADSNANDAILGIPFDTVIIKQSGTTRRNFFIKSTKGKKFTVINANDDNNNIYIYIRGELWNMAGGVAVELFNAGYDNLLPAGTSTDMGGGIIILSKYDNDW